LHNIRGWIIHLLDRLKATKRLDVNVYNAKLKEFKLSPKDCNGEKLRKIILNFEEIIIPSLIYNKDNQKPIAEDLRKVLNIFVVIVWIAYSPLEAQAFVGIRLLLHWKCFELSIALQDLPGDLELMDLYLHVILAHFPLFFDEYSFQLASTEPLERLFVILKRGKYFTNRHKDNFMASTFRRFEAKELRTLYLFKDDPQKILEEMCIKTMVKIEDQFSNFREKLKLMEDIEFTLPKANNQSTQAVFTHLFVNSLLNNDKYKHLVTITDGKEIRMLHNYFIINDTLFNQAFRKRWIWK